MGTVEGIGGVFIDSSDAPALADWYHRHLDIDFSEHPEGGSFYIVFQTRDVATGKIRESPVFAINQADTPLANPQQRGIAVNLRVDDLERTLSRLAGEGGGRRGAADRVGGGQTRLDPRSRRKPPRTLRGAPTTCGFAVSYGIAGRYLTKMAAFPSRHPVLQKGPFGPIVSCRERPTVQNMHSPHTLQQERQHS